LICSKGVALNLQPTLLPVEAVGALPAVEEDVAVVVVASRTAPTEATAPSSRTVTMAPSSSCVAFQATWPFVAGSALMLRSMALRSNDLHRPPPTSTAWTPTGTPTPAPQFTSRGSLRSSP
jgi:hypothetical protein